jgi:hypothetical protein
VILVRHEQTYRVELSFIYKIGRWIMDRIVIVILIYHRHKPTNVAYLRMLSLSHRLRICGVYEAMIVDDDGVKHKRC